jgi:hypothetical protein
VKVRQKDFDRWVAEGKITQGDAKIAAHIASPIGNRKEDWEVGKHIQRDQYDHVKGPSGDVYVLEVFEKGEAHQHFVPENIWLQAKDAMDNV